MPTTIAIVGRPNVGKSTLFNRLLKRNAALTHDMPGVTRDRIYAETMFGDRKVALVDTGGLELDETVIDDIGEGIFSQAREAVEEAQGLLIVMDGREGLTTLDERVAEYIRRSNKPVLLAVNKVDGEELEHTGLAEFHGLGFEMIAVSAEHGFNVKGLRDDMERVLLDNIPEEPEEGEPVERGLRISMLGRPNAGKSSMINALIGEYRLIVSPEAGTTRDTVDVTLESRGKRYTFVDTAGVRKKARIDNSLERFSVLRALKSSKRSNVSILVLDALKGVSMQDKRLLSFVMREKTPFIVVVNKIDLVEPDELPRVKQLIDDELRICRYAPVVYTSTVSKAGLGGLLPLAERLHAECQIRVTTGELNRAMKTVIERHQPPQVKYRRAKFYYLTQIETEPPTFAFFVNNPQLVKDSYKKYLENQLRKLFGIKHAPLRLLYKSSHGDREKSK